MAMQSLQAKLDAKSRASMEIAAWRAAYEQVVATLSGNGLLPHVLAKGASFPDFMLPNAEGRLVSLGALLANGPVVVTFFRGEWCPYCRLMLDALAEALPEIEALGATLVALTPDTDGLPLVAKQAHQAKFEVLSDVDCGVGLAAGVVFAVPPLYRARLSSFGVDIAQRHGNQAWFLPIPATFILDRNGVIVWRFADGDFTNRAEPGDIIGVLETLSG
jgi:peroxiredoxin